MAAKAREQLAAKKTKPTHPVMKKQEITNGDSSDSGSDGSDDSDGSDSGSGSDFDVEAERKKLADKQAAKRKEPEAKKNGNKSEHPKIIPDAKKSSATKASTEATTTSSDESDSDSDTDSDTSSSGNDATATQKATTKQGSKDESSSESDSGSESSDEGENEKQNEDEASEIGSDDSDESSDESVDAMEVDGNDTAVSRVDAQVDAEGSNSQVSKPAWMNNSNFVLRKAGSDNPAKEVADFFKKTNLEGKQVWYFTAPASLPITVLKDMEIDLSKATAGQALLNHNGDDYGLDLESQATNTQIQLLIPSPAGDNYNSLNRGIDSTVHLRRIAKFGPSGVTKATATDAYTPIPKPVREQPQGLKPRFTPIGVPTPLQTPPQVQSQPQVQPEPQPQVQAHSKSKSKSKSQKTRSTPMAKVDPYSVPESSPESGSESDSDVDMTTVSKPQKPAPSQLSKKAEKPAVVNGKTKRKHPTDEEVKSTPTQQPQSSEKPAKRPKTDKSASKTSHLKESKKETPVRPPVRVPVASTPNGTPTPSKSSTSKSNGKEKESDKPKSAVKTMKQTPIPVPHVLSMKR